jgi:hypothetical protein
VDRADDQRRCGGDIGGVVDAAELLFGTQVRLEGLRETARPRAALTGAPLRILAVACRSRAEGRISADHAVEAAEDLRL